MESLIASVLLATSVVAISLAVTSGHMQSSHALRTQRAQRLVEEIMEFLLSQPYHDPDGGANPGPEMDEASPSNYDNIDDFHGYYEAPGSLANVSGTLFPPEYQVFHRSVTVEYGSHTVDALGGVVLGLTATVTVWDAAGLRWEIRRFVPEPAD